MAFVKSLRFRGPVVTNLYSSGKHFFSVKRAKLYAPAGRDSTVQNPPSNATSIKITLPRDASQANQLRILSRRKQLRRIPDRPDDCDIGKADMPYAATTV